jgi:hypothetical protein
MGGSVPGSTEYKKLKKKLSQLALNVNSDVFLEMAYGFELLQAEIALDDRCHLVIDHVPLEAGLGAERPVALGAVDGAPRVVVLQVQLEPVYRLAEFATQVAQLELRDDLVIKPSVSLEPFHIL